MDNMIFGTLWYLVEEMNNDVEIRYNDFTHRDEKITYFDVVKVNIDEENQIGTATIKDLKNNTTESWYWDNEIDMWWKED
jgi:hypothetical protein